jgi:hypothetical protein
MNRSDDRNQALKRMNPAVAQLDRAFGFYPKCWGFDSLRPDQFLA